MNLGEVKMLFALEQNNEKKNQEKERKHIVFLPSLCMMHIENQEQRGYQWLGINEDITDKIEQLDV